MLRKTQWQVEDYPKLKLCLLAQLGLLFRRLPCLNQLKSHPICRISLNLPRSKPDFPWDVPSYVSSFATCTSLGHPLLPSGEDVARSTQSRTVGHSPHSSDEHVAIYKTLFCSLAITKSSYLVHVVDWALQMACSMEHRVIADCLDFLNTEAQLHTPKLRPYAICFWCSLFLHHQKLLLYILSIEWTVFNVLFGHMFYCSCLCEPISYCGLFQ